MGWVLLKTINSSLLFTMNLALGVSSSIEGVSSCTEGVHSQVKRRIYRACLRVMKDKEPISREELEESPYRIRHGRVLFIVGEDMRVKARGRGGASGWAWSSVSVRERQAERETVSGAVGGAVGR